MVKEYYSIGETAKLLGVTTQTLRFYDKKGLVCPKMVHHETGYRYYTFDQFHYIDRIRYLQKFGMSLEDIKKIILSGSVDQLLPFLEKQKEVTVQELEKAKNKIDDIEWYINYFTFLNKTQNQGTLYKIQLPKRYVLAVPCYPETDIPISKMEIRLAKVKGQKKFQNLEYLRQYAYIVNFEKLLSRTFHANYYFIYLKEKPDFETEYLIDLPEGEYLCYRARILTDDWNEKVLTDFFEGGSLNRLVIANEFEENLVEYANTQYEIQILL